MGPICMPHRETLCLSQKSMSQDVSVNAFKVRLLFDWRRLHLHPYRRVYLELVMLRKRAFPRGPSWPSQH